MAQRVEVMLVDDLDGSDADETVTFGLDGVTYEIDLNAENAQQLRDDLASWVGHARRAGGRRTSGRGPSQATSKRADLGEVRQWARKHGFEVSDRGRISGEVQAAYDKAH